MSIKNTTKIAWIWLVLRFEEGFRSASRPSSSKGLNLRDGALAMAAVRIPMCHVRFLIEFGANPAVHDSLALRMAAANGDIDMLRWLIELSEPSDYALEDAFNWASGKQRTLAATLLKNMMYARNQRKSSALSEI